MMEEINSMNEYVVHINITFLHPVTEMSAYIICVTLQYINTLPTTLVEKDLQEKKKQKLTC